jgi:hypothetical protein
MDSGWLWFAMQVFFTSTRPNVQHRCGLHVFYGPCVGNLIFRPILFARADIRHVLLCVQDTVTSSRVTTSLGSTTAHLIPTIRLTHYSCHVPSLYPVDVDAICKCWGGVPPPSNLSRPSLFRNEICGNEHVSMYGEATPFLNGILAISVS